MTLHRILVHMIAETHRHAGHADIVRELIDGAVGLREQAPNLPPDGEEQWESHRAQIEAAARGGGVVRERRIRRKGPATAERLDIRLSEVK